MRELYIGVMSGTSLDGVDVALCAIDADGVTLVSALEYPFDGTLKADILAMIQGRTTLEKVGQLDHRLGQLFGDAVNALFEKERLDRSTIMAIGSHGQTLWHDPEGDYPFSMQLGDPNIIATKTGVSCVADFRRKDIALGGQGAPFAPAFHYFLFKSLPQKVAVVNIGGMANISVLGEEPLGFDTGPGNVLMDLWVKHSKGLDYDRDGEWASGGEVDDGLLDTFLADPYFSKLPPKSTGRERFNMQWLSHQLKAYDEVDAQDVQRSLLELTAHTIAKDAREAACELLLVCGGGARNKALMQRLGESMGDIPVAVTDMYGVDTDHLEAMAFAWLAYKRIHHEKVGLSSVTGAREDGLLGGIYG